MKMPLKIVLFFCCTLMTFIISADTTWTWTYDLAKAEWKDRKCVFPDPSTYESSFTGAHFPILEACFMVEVNKPTSGPELQQLNLCQLLYGLSILCCSHKKQFVETSLIKEEINKITSDFESGSKDRNVCSYASNLPMNISQHLPYLANKATCQQICMGKNAHEKRFEPVCELFVAVMCKLGGKEKCDLPSKTVKPYGSLKSSQPRKLSEPYYSDIGHEQEKGEKKLYGDNKREHSEPALKESSSYKMKNLFPLFVIVIIVLVICGSFITYSKCFAKKNKVSKSIFSVMDQTQSKHNFTIYKPWKQPGHTKLKDTDDSLPLLV